MSKIFFVTCLCLFLTFTALETLKPTQFLHNTTYGEHLTEIKIENVPYGNHFIVDVYDTPMAEIESGEEFVKTLEEIVSFNNGTCVNSKIHLFGNEKKNPYTALFLLAESHISFHTWNQNRYVAFDLYTCANNVNTYNSLAMILHYLKSDNYRVKHVVRSTIENVDTSKYPHYKKGDLMIKDDSIPAIIHDSKVISWKKTKYQNALFIQSKTLGNGLLVNSQLQYMDKLVKKNLFIRENINESKPKSVLIVGENDLSVLKEVLHDNVESVTFVYFDEELIQMTKEIIHPDFNEWMNDKAKIIFKNGYEYLSETTDKFDLILLDGFEVDEPNLKLFKKIKASNMNSNSKILLKSIKDHLSESPLKEIFTIAFTSVDSPKSHHFYTLN
jgi:S-adenosylmethionine decarboxylase proenzyme